VASDKDLRQLLKQSKSKNKAPVKPVKQTVELD